MEPTQVCYFFHSGNCWNGDKCTFFHPTEECRNFSRSGWCPYGYCCRFLHRPSEKYKDKNLVRAPCKFFANFQCKYGDKCNFSHDINDAGVDGITLAEYRVGKRLTQLQLKNELVNAEFPSNPSTLTPFDLEQCVKLKDATEDKIISLNKNEVKQFLKTYCASNIISSASSDNGQSFLIKFSSSDHEWSYSVHEIFINLLIPKLYPMKPMQITVEKQDNIPTILLEHLNSCIASWVERKHEGFEKNGCIELYLQPFLRWLDRSLEDLFTDGLRRYKSFLLGDSSNSIQSCAINNIADTRESSPLSDTYSAHKLSDKEDVDVNINGDNVDEWDHFGMVSENSPLISGTQSHHFNTIERLSLTQSCSTDNNDTVQQANSQDVKSEHKQEIKNLLSTPKVPCTDTNRHKSGTQKVILHDLNLRGKAGIYLQRKLFVVLHCVRCRLQIQWNFHMKAAKVTASASDDKANQTCLFCSHPPHNTQCARCRLAMKLLFEASIVHKFNSCVGILFLEGCIADDISPQQSEALLGCMECNDNVAYTKLEPGRLITKHCTKCHSLVGLKFSHFSLEVITPVSVVSSNAPSQFVKSTAEKPARSINRSSKSAQNPLIREGTSLPDFGRCKHYRKSYRWLRFPCCGLLKSCDVCHDDAVTDGHEMEMANHMVCGFCSKEQPFSQTKPCVKCGKFLCGSKSSHWEGGKGCRNRATMSRKDTKKYNATNKTVSRKQGNK